MKRNKLKAFLLLSPLLLTACSDENAEQCKTLINDEAMRSLSISFCEKPPIMVTRNHNLILRLYYLRKETKKKRSLF